MSLRFNGGINYEIINDYFNQILNQNLKLSLFLGLDCKPMKDVILHHPDWTIHVKDNTMQRLEQSSEVRRAVQHEAFMMANSTPTHGLGCIDCAHEALSIEAIPKRLTTDELTIKHIELIEREMAGEIPPLEEYDRNNL